MANYLVTDTQLTSVADAIRAKTGGSTGLSFPDGMVSAVGQINTGSGEPSVVFIDYDGTVVATKTKAEINAMTSDSDLPANPSHTGLTAQGWNWTVAQLKAQLTAMPDQVVYVGQMYITTSEDTEIDCIFQDGRLSPILTICVNGEITVDWGDNTTPDTVTGNSTSTKQAVPHTYASAGNYTIKISVISGSISFKGDNSCELLRKNNNSSENRVYSNCVQAIRLGKGIQSIGANAFQSCYSLTSITIPSGVTNIGTNAFQGCYVLVSITIPNGVTSIENYTFQDCSTFTSITIPHGVTSIGTNVFQSCYSLTSITIPSGVTNIGDYTFQNCYSLASITIPNEVTNIGTNTFQNCNTITSITIPNSVTSIGTNAFQSCSTLASITIQNEVTSIGAYAFSDCHIFASITIPSEITSIEAYMFQYCYSLASITIPSKVTSIGKFAFRNCYSLASITIPSGVTSIGNSAFTGCSGMKEYHLFPENPPTLGTTVFASIPSDCVIYVPSASLSDYQTASGWSSYASQMVGE